MLATMPVGEAPPPPPANRVTEPEPTAAYGEYLASHTCEECHGQALTGSTGPGPAGPSLAAAARWSLEQFSQAARQDVALGGRRLSQDMPSKHFAHLTEMEVEALHDYLRTLDLQAR